MMHGPRPVPPPVAQRRARAAVRRASGTACARRGCELLRPRQRQCRGASRRYRSAEDERAAKHRGKSRGGWDAKIHMVSASSRQAMIFSLSGGQAHDAPGRPRPAGELGRSGRGCASGDGLRLRGRQDPPARPRHWDDAGRASEGEPESQMELRPGNLQDADRDRRSVPEIQGLPTHLHAVRQARRDVSGLREPRRRCRNDA